MKLRGFLFLGGLLSWFTLVGVRAWKLMFFCGYWIFFIYSGSSSWSIWGPSLLYKLMLSYFDIGSIIESFFLQALVKGFNHSWNLSSRWMWGVASLLLLQNNIQKSVNSFNYLLITFGHKETSGKKQNKTKRHIKKPGNAPGVNEAILCHWLSTWSQGVDVNPRLAGTEANYAWWKTSQTTTWDAKWKVLILVYKTNLWGNLSGAVFFHQQYQWINNIRNTN